MKINHLISSGGLYGAEKMILNLASAQQRLGLSPTITVFDNSHASNLEVVDVARAAGIEVSTLPCRGRFDPKAVRRLRADLRGGLFQVLHTHGYKANLYGYLASRKLNLTVVGTCHRFDTGSHNKLDGPILRQFNAVAGVSDEAAASLVSVYRLNPNQVVSIPNGIAPAQTPKAEDSALGRQHDGIANRNIGMVGRLAPEKAPEDFIKVAAKIHAEFPDTRFLVAGDGDMRSELMDQAAASGLSTAIDFLGFVEDVDSVYDHIAILLQPSLREGMPMTTLEAMAKGIAIVATTVGALPDLITDGRNGRLVAPHDVTGMTAAVRGLLTDPVATTEMAKRGRADVLARYGSDRMAERYLNFYKHAAQPPSTLGGLPAIATR
jgi:glycosyltransferase involved in cell wall biosynthesis